MISGSMVDPNKLSATDAMKLRMDIWLWFYLQRKMNANFPTDNFMAARMQRDMEEFAHTMHTPIAWIIESQSGRYLLPQERLEWITDDKRQTMWLQSYMWNKLRSGFFLAPPRLLDRNFVIASIDIWEEELSSKASAVNQMKWDWERHRQSDQIFKWFREKDEVSRCEVAEKWISEKMNISPWQSPLISSHEDLLMFFDRQLIVDAEKKLIVEAIKKRVSQQRYRKKMVGKKQCNLMLSNKAILDLDKLATKYGVSRPQIIETLIQFETTRSIYLPEKIRSIAWGEQTPTS